MKKRSISKLLEDLFDLRETEINCFLRVYNSREATLQKLSKYLRKDVTHISRCLKKLLDLGLILREPRCCGRGKRGRYWVYKSLSKTKFKKLLRERAKEIYAKQLKTIRKI